MHTSMCCHGKYFAVIDTFLTPHYNQSNEPHRDLAHIYHIHCHRKCSRSEYIYSPFISRYIKCTTKQSHIWSRNNKKNTCKSKNRIWHHCVLCLSLKITEITFQELFPFTCQHVDL